MSEDRGMERRKALKRIGYAATGTGLVSSVGTVGADPENGTDTPPGLGSKVGAETYVETDSYVYRRVWTDRSDYLYRVEVDTGEVAIAKLSSETVMNYEPSEDSAGLESQIRESVFGDVESDASSTIGNNLRPAQIADSTGGVSVQSSGVVFERIDVEERDIGGCGNFLYDSHKYFHIAMQLQDYDFDDIGDVVGIGVVCDALFVLVGKKSKTLKKVLKKIADTPLIRAIPDGICSFIFGTILDGVFSNGTGTFALWDYDTEDVWGTTPKLAFDGDAEYDPEPSDVIESGAMRNIPTAHINKFT